MSEKIDPTELRRKLEEAEHDRDEQRTLTGKYAPKPGVCRVCGGRTVVAQIGYPHTDVLGGPPLRAFIRGWHCENCGIEYHFCPQDPPPAPRL